MNGATPGTHLKRMALILALGLLFGALVNILVAWGCLLRKPISGSAPWSRSGQAYRWPIATPANWPDAPTQFDQTYGIGWALHTTRTFAEFPRITLPDPALPDQEVLTDYVECIVEVWHCGWPRASLRAIAITPDPAGGPGAGLLDGIPMPNFMLGLSNWKPTYLPTRPEPKAFAINTLLYGLPITLPLLVIHPVRRRLRRRAGLCAYCKYPIGPSPICTECGVPLPKRKIAV